MKRSGSARPSTLFQIRSKGDQQSFLGEMPSNGSFAGPNDARPMDQQIDALSDNLTISSDKIFLEIYHQNVRKLLDFATRYLDNTVEIEDAVSDVFVRLWEKKLEIQGIQNIRNFLFTSVRNACLDTIKRNKNRLIREGLVLQLESIDALENPLDIEEALVTRLLKEVDYLPDRCKHVFELAFFGQQKNSEIATLLGLSNSAVRSHKARALQLLRLKVFSQKLVLSVVLYVSIALFP